MSKKYNLSGLSENVEFGKDGKRIKDTGANLAVRNPADSALAVLDVADGVGSTNAATKGQLDALATGVGLRSATLTFNAASTLNIGAAVTGSFGFKWQVSVSTVFDGAAPTLELGISGGVTDIATDAQIDLTTTGIYSGSCHLDISSSTQMIATYVADSSTAGVAVIIVEWF